MTSCCWISIPALKLNWIKEDKEIKKIHESFLCLESVINLLSEKLHNHAFFVEKAFLHCCSFFNAQKVI